MVTGQNIDKPKRRQTETPTDRNVKKPKWRQTKTSTDQNVDKPERQQTETNQNVNKPKRCTLYTRVCVCMHACMFIYIYTYIRWDVMHISVPITWVYSIYQMHKTLYQRVVCYFCSNCIYICYCISLRPYWIMTDENWSSETNST